SRPVAPGRRSRRPRGRGPGSVIARRSPGDRARDRVRMRTGPRALRRTYRAAPLRSAPMDIIEPDIDVGWMREVLLELLRVPSPTGRTDVIMQHVGERL